MEWIMEKFSPLDSISSKKMFGGYVIHMAGKVLGFVFENEFLFEPGPAIDRILPDAPRKELFPGSKLFVVIDESISSTSLCQLACECYDDMPVSKPRKKKKKELPNEEFPFAESVENWKG